MAALFMVKTLNLTPKDVLEGTRELSFPESVVGTRGRLEPPLRRVFPRSCKRVSCGRSMIEAGGQPSTGRTAAGDLEQQMAGRQ